MTTTGLFSPTKAATARTLIGGGVLADNRNDLLKQIVVAVANKTGGGTSGLTINTTTVSGAAANDFLISDGTKLQKLTPGSGVATAFAAALDGTGGLASKSYADALVAGLLDDRGNYNASVNTFPAGGGSGTAGAVLKGDLWTVSVAGTLGGNAVTVGDVVRALTDTPGQTSANWAITENNLGYVPVNAAGTLALAGFSGVTGTLAVANGGTGITALGTGVATMLGVAVTGSGGSVLQTSPTLITPLLGTPTSGVLTSCTGLPVLTGLSGLGTGVATALGNTTNASGGLLTFGNAAVLAANTFTGIQTLPNGSAAAPALNLGDSTTGFYRSALNEISLAGAGTQRFKFDSSGTLYLLGAGANSKVSFQGSGVTTTLASNGYGDAIVCSNTFSAPGFQNSSGGNITFRSNGNVQLGSGSLLGWASTSDGAGTIDTSINRNGAGILELKSGTTQQTFRVYGTTTSNKYLQLTHDGTNAVLSASSGTLKHTTVIQFANANTTGAGSALLGMNSPASALSAPYTWETVQSSDGSTCYMPLWK